MATIAEYIRKNPPVAFAPRPYYTRESDTVTFIFKDEPAYAERIDTLLTVYRSRATKELVGCEVKGVRQRLQVLGNFGVIMLDGQKPSKPVQLGLLFLAYAAASEPATLPIEMYQRLGTIASRVGAELDPEQLVVT